MRGLSFINFTVNPPLATTRSHCIHDTRNYAIQNDPFIIPYLNITHYVTSTVLETWSRWFMHVFRTDDPHQDVLGTLTIVMYRTGYKTQCYDFE